MRNAIADPSLRTVSDDTNLRAGLAKAAEESNHDHDRSDQDALAQSLANGNFLLRFHGVLLKTAKA